MIPPQVAYVRPDSLDAACSHLAEVPGSVPMGGGTMLVPELGRGDRLSSAVVDLGALGLDTEEIVDGHLELGSMVTYSQVMRSPHVFTIAPLLSQLARGVTGGPQIRNQGTVGGSACRAMPSSDVPAALMALEVTMRLRGVQSSREVPVDQFFLGAGRTVLQAGEVLSHVVIPVREAPRQAYVKFKLCESSWPIVTAAAVVRAEAKEAIVAVGGLDQRPLRIRLELSGAEGWPPAAALRDMLLTEVTHEWTDELATAGYRRKIAGVIARRALEAADANSTEGQTP
jgi:carbon-monoxide dehydrogenase medium subunit